MNQQLETNRNHSPQTRPPSHPRFTPLKDEDRTHIDTACAAYHLGRRPQTMRSWACRENGPLRPHRINGRLAWKVEEIKRLLRSEC